MRIGIDARPLATCRTGIGNYVRGLVQLFPRVAPEHEYFLYSNKEINSRICEGEVQERFDSLFQHIPGSLWHWGRGGSHAKRDRLDVFWSTFPILPRLTPPHVLKIVTVYDLVWMRFPETMVKYNLLVHQLGARRAIRNADFIVVISRSTGDELVRTFGVPEEKVKLVYPGISGHFKPQDSREAAGYLSTRYGTPTRYMAAVGTIEPRKNLSLLVKSLGILKERGELACPLLIAGASGWRNSHLAEDIRAAKLSDKDIQFMGFLPDEDLAQFYAGAELFLFPTLYEGFGLPPVEAMACGTPVIASNAQCMPEVLGDAAILEPADRADRFADAINQLLLSESLRMEMRSRGVRQARKYTWEASAQQLSMVFNALGKGGRAECPSNVLA